MGPSTAVRWAGPWCTAVPSETAVPPRMPEAVPTLRTLGWRWKRRPLRDDAAPRWNACRPRYSPLLRPSPRRPTASNGTLRRVRMKLHSRVRQESDSSSSAAFLCFVNSMLPQQPHNDGKSLNTVSTATTATTKRTPQLGISKITLPNTNRPRAANTSSDSRPTHRNACLREQLPTRTGVSTTKRSVEQRTIQYPER